jgi:hypothetical protein
VVAAPQNGHKRYHQPDGSAGHRTYRVIGVMPRDFVFRDTRRGFWIQVTPRLRVDRGSHYLNCVAWRDHRGSDEGGFC